MQERRKKKKIIAGLAFLLAAVLFVTNFQTVFPHLAKAASGAAVLSALAAMPEGGKAMLNGDPLTQATTQPASTQAQVTTTTQAPTTQQQTTTAPPTTAVMATPKAGQGKVVAQTYGKSSANLSYQNVLVSNRTSKKVDLASELKQKPNIEIPDTDQPVVLIFHTHATESYVPRADGTYDKGVSTRSTDNSKNMNAVGDELAKVLNAAGFKTVHDKTLHDYPSYNGGYNRSLKTIQNQLKKYPTIKVALDLHRDAIERDDGTKIKPVASIGGKQAAQIMIAAGCQDGDVKGFPNWKQNFRFALQIQKQCAADYPNLARPIYFIDKKYNEFVMPGSLLIEMGTDGNTLEEAKYSAQLLGNSLVKVLKTLM